MSTNMTIDGYVVSFDNFKKFTPKNEKQNYDSCNLKVNVANISKDTNGKTIYTMIDLFATGKTAEFLDQYSNGDRIICHADFNGINTYQSGQEIRANIKATVRNVVLYAPRKDISENSTTTNSAPQVNNNATQPSQITPPQGFNSPVSAPVIDIPQPNITPQINNGTTQKKQKRNIK